MRANSKSGLVVAVFCSVLVFMPILGMFFPDINITPAIIENRALAEKPAFNWASLASYPESFENYFNDHFGYRQLLIRLNSLFKHKILKSNSSDELVISGKEGWLFYTGDDTVYDYQGVNPFTPNELEQWRIVLERKRNWLKSRGIEYLFLIAPNKSSIYPEYLPSWLKRVNNSTPLDQMIAYLRENSDIEILDLRGALKKQKVADHFLYFPTDTHWNHLGAFVAYCEIMSRIEKVFPKATALPFEKFQMKYAKKGGGDLAKLLGTQEDVVEEQPILVPLMPRAKQVYWRNEPLGELLMESHVPELPRIVMFGDSFSTALVPFLSESFSVSKYIWCRWENDPLIEQIIVETKPDIVIEEWCERYINKMRHVSFASREHP